MSDYSALTSVIVDTLSAVLPAIAALALAIVIVHFAEWAYYTVLSMFDSGDSFGWFQDKDGNWHNTDDDN